MGELSVEVGPAVSFLMTALNLRLGPLGAPSVGRAGQAAPMPGLLFYREMFGQTRQRACADGTRSRDVHLSEAATSRTSALYELVRRHCRYIIVVRLRCRS